MMDVKKYIVDGELKRDKIVADIKRGRISTSDIMELDRMQEVREAYFGDGYDYKVDKDKWNASYLDKLALVSVSETFNKEYMLYLNEVAECVVAKEQQNLKNNTLIRTVITIAIVVALIVFVVVFYTSKAKNL